MLKIPVAREDREAVLEMLKSAQHGTVPMEGVDEGLDTIPVFEVFRTRHLHRHLVYVFLSVVAGIFLILYGESESHRRFRVRDGSASLGCIGQLLLWVWMRYTVETGWNSHRAAVRPPRLCWICRDRSCGNWCAMSAPCGSMFIAPWICYAIAFLYGVLTVRAFRYYFRDTRWICGRKRRR